ncbi:Acetylornithine deacetylase [Tenacibaculum litopenaei]|uniref:M20 family metallo-hydrolase n=1 Tax=Tenacibaculum litopenaei TaxID=396016 RepID=UPI0038940097
MTLKTLTTKAIGLLEQLIETPSFSSEESATASLLEHWCKTHEIAYTRINNNVWAKNKFFNPSLPTLLLNSHHDTVKPNNGYTKNPFQAIREDGKLYGLGSNDAGGCLVSLLATFTYFYAQPNLKYNLVFAGTAEEESSGPNGLNSLLQNLPPIDVAIVGEPTEMKLAIAEKGLIVYDAVVSGTPGHAAHPNDDNPIYKTVDVLRWFQQVQFEKESEVLGPVKVTVSQINAGKQHNAIPSQVNLVVDVRVNDRYQNEEIDRYFQQYAPCTMTARGLHLNASSIPAHHELVLAGKKLGMPSYGSPTLSDQVVLNCPSLKLGPGDSTRSHTADEFIYLREIEAGIEQYIQLLNNVI